MFGIFTTSCQVALRGDYPSNLGKSLGGGKNIYEERSPPILNYWCLKDWLEFNGTFTFASMAEKDLYAPCKFEIELWGTD